MLLWIACSSPPPPPVVFEEPASPQAVEAEKFCPSGRGEGTSNAAVVGFDTTVLPPVFPEEITPWKRKDFRSQAKGIPVTVELVTTSYLDGERKIQAFAADRIHDCTGAAGTGAAMMAALGTGEGMTREETTLAGNPAVLYKNADAWAVESWFGDRCQVVVGGGSGVTKDDVMFLANKLDLRELHPNCKSR
jgi:hypothetical protein